jgi:hypothetical protein
MLQSKFKLEAEKIVQQYHDLKSLSFKKDNLAIKLGLVIVS